MESSEPVPSQSTKTSGIPAEELHERIKKLKEEVMSGEIQAKISRRKMKQESVEERLKKAENVNIKAQEHIKKLSWDNAILEKKLNEAQKLASKLENQVKNCEDLNKMLEIELDQRRTIDKGLETLRARMTQQAEEMEKTKEDLTKANERAKQVESVALKAREKALENCGSCDSKMEKIRELNQRLEERDKQVARMKVTHQKHVAELAENRNQSKCDCRYKVMEAKAEVETHVAAGEKLKSEREKYKSLFHQYAKERKNALDRLQDCEDKLADKDEKIRRLRHENNSNVNNAGRDRGFCGTKGDCRIVGNVKETVEQLTEELRQKGRDVAQLRDLVAKLDANLVETEQHAEAAKNENAQLATEMIERLREYEGCVAERETLLHENARLKMDMVAMVPKLDSKSPRKASAIAEFDRLTEKLQDTERQLIDCRKELRKLRSENQKKEEKSQKAWNRQRGNNVNNNNENVHGGNHRNCLTCRLLNKLQMGMSDCEKCKDTSRPCRCQRGAALPASIRREIEDFEVPWPGGSSDWREVERLGTATEARRKSRRENGNHENRSIGDALDVKSEIFEGRRSSKVTFEPVDDMGANGGPEKVRSLETITLDS